MADINLPSYEEASLSGLRKLHQKEKQNKFNIQGTNPMAPRRRQVRLHIYDLPDAPSTSLVGLGVYHSVSSTHT